MHKEKHDFADKILSELQQIPDTFGSQGKRMKDKP